MVGGVVLGERGSGGMSWLCGKEWGREGNEGLCLCEEGVWGGVGFGGRD